MIIGSISENLKLEKRVAITPDTIKKYKSLGLEVHLTKDYAKHLGIEDEEYKTEGAVIKSEDEVLSNSNAIIQLTLLNDENLNKLFVTHMFGGLHFEFSIPNSFCAFIV